MDGNEIGVVDNFCPLTVSIITIHFVLHIIELFWKPKFSIIDPVLASDGI